MPSSAPSVADARPRFTPDEAARLAAELYDLPGTLTPLPSDRDQNFLLHTADARYVLKIASALEDRAILEAQHAALRHLADHDLPNPRVIPGRDEATIQTAAAPEGREHLVRLLTYLPGTPLAEAAPQTPALLHELGHYLGRLDAALLGFDHSGAHRTMPWDVRHAAATIRERLGDLHAPPQRALVEGFLDRFEQDTLPHLNGLRRSVIHGDANDYNVLVGPPRLHDRAIAGIVDWGDMVHTLTVAELAVAAAYAMLDKPDPLGAAVPLVRGYHEALPLTEDELAVLFPLITMRLCISVCMSARQRRAEPENAYLSVSERPAWALLERLAAVPPALAHYTFRQACGLPPCPHAPAVVRWLRDHADDLAPIVTPDPRTAPCLVFDFGVSSPDWALGAPHHPMNDAAILLDQLRAAGAHVGVGSYEEVRLVYTAAQFRTAATPDAEQRTIHIGLDLFQPAGAPIFAPLDGVVHSVRDNDRPLDYGPTVILRHEPPDAPVFYSLYGHLSRASLEHLHTGQAVRAGDQLGTLGDVHENGGWAPHLHLQLITDLLGFDGDFPGVAPASARDVWTSLSPDANLLVGIPAEAFPDPPAPPDALRERRRRHLGPSLSLSYRRPLKIVRGFMQHLYDHEGRIYLDAVNNVPHVGHEHPRVVAAGQRQMAVLNTNTRYLHDLIVRYSERLTALLPDPLSVCFFVNSGSEANDLALRLARTYTGARDVVVLDHAYHGHLTSLIEISPYKFDGPGGPGKPLHTHVAPMPDPYRGRYRGTSVDVGQRYAEHVREAIEAAGRDGRRIAAFIAESIAGVGGQVVWPDGFLQAAYAHVRAAGGLCIADEVQVGFGRVGSHRWGFELQGVVPDIVTMGKPMGNGHPIAAVVTTPAVAEAFANGMEYFNTFGGNPVSCAVGLAVLDVLEDEDLQGNALRTGTYLLDGLRELQRRHPIIGDVRGRGLFVGVELVRDPATLDPAPDAATYIAERMRDHRILLSTDGPHHNVLKIKPPLVFSPADADRLVATLDAVLAEDFVRG